MDRVQTIVVGAGVVGLAISRALALAGRDVIILEAEGGFGTATSSRNSEVIHAGIYYAPGSLKARLCVRGKELLYAYCAAHGIAHRRTEKLIVATSAEEESALDALMVRAHANGVSDLVRLSGTEARRLESSVFCTAALLSPSSGAVDSHGLMLALLGDAEGAGATVAYHALVTRVAPNPDGFEVTVKGAEGEYRIWCSELIMSPGLGSWDLARRIDGFPQELIPPRHLSKGCYCTMTGRAPFERLIYPVPGVVSLGLHASRDLAGRTRFGPDHRWVADIEYSLPPNLEATFYEAVRRYFPDLADGSLMPDFAGIRPKIQAPGAPPHDFVIQGPAAHGMDGLVTLFGIESPGLTASLAIAEYVAEILEGVPRD